MPPILAQQVLFDEGPAIRAPKRARTNKSSTPKRRKPVDITFKGGLTEPFHRWFRLTPSYSPRLVAEWLDRNPLGGSGVLLDPFSGAGTTCIVGQSRGLDCLGFEINPFLAFVSRISNDWRLTDAQLLAARDAVLDEAASLLSSYPNDTESFCAALGTTPPPIHNVYRWWKPEVLRELIAVREAIKKWGGAAKQHLLLALAQCVYPTANITLGRLQVAFVNREADVIDARAFFVAAVEAIAEDLRLKPAKVGSVRIVNADSRVLNEVSENVAGVFCSPPYPNRYSYVWNTRPHLYLLELISTAKAAADIDCDTIGGTWGRATSILGKHPIKPTSNVHLIMSDILLRLGANSLLMRNYVCKYFNDLDAHLFSLKSRLNEGAPLGYVVGNSETKGVMVDTPELLAKLMELNGYERAEIEPLRARNSGVGLVESTVSARMPTRRP